VTTIKRQKGGRKLKTTTKIIFQRFVDEKKDLLMKLNQSPKQRQSAFIRGMSADSLPAKLAPFFKTNFCLLCSRKRKTNVALLSVIWQTI